MALWRCSIQFKDARTGLWVPDADGWDVGEAENAASLADHIAGQLRPGQRVAVYADEGVGRAPVAVAYGPGKG